MDKPAWLLEGELVEAQQGVQLYKNTIILSEGQRYSRGWTIVTPKGAGASWRLGEEAKARAFFATTVEQQA